MNTNHTPGPWTYKATATPDYAKQFAIYPEVSGSGHDIALVYSFDHETEANAALMAAAPTMLAALEEIANPDLAKDIHGLMIIARDAIAATKG